MAALTFAPLQLAPSVLLAIMYACARGRLVWPVWTAGQLVGVISGAAMERYAPGDSG